ncbi:MAG TPA: hypothetical protein PK198_19810, partial [Saprospiraceae bacterium]|nr:hypothetical protein [Saprospiraceae bacterium]
YTSHRQVRSRFCHTWRCHGAGAEGYAQNFAAQGIYDSALVLCGAGIAISMLNIVIFNNF